LWQDQTAKRLDDFQPVMRTNITARPFEVLTLIRGNT
jgi:hypothetical protein